MIVALLGRTLRQLGLVLGAAALFLCVFEFGLVFIATAFDSAGGLERIVEFLPTMFQDLLLSKMKDFSPPALVPLGFHHPLAYMIVLGLTVLLGTAPAADRESGLIDLIVSRPVPRRAYLLSVLLGMLLIQAALPLAILVGGLIGVQVFDVPLEDPVVALAKAAAGQSSLMCAVGGLTLLCSVGCRRRFNAVLAVLAILLPMFVVDFLSYMWSGLHEVRWASLFHYVPSMPGADTVDFRLGVAVLWTVGALTSLAAFARWQRQDL